MWYEIGGIRNRSIQPLLQAFGIQERKNVHSLSSVRQSIFISVERSKVVIANIIPAAFTSELLHADFHQTNIHIGSCILQSVISKRTDVATGAAVNRWSASARATVPLNVSSVAIVITVGS